MIRNTLILLMIAVAPVCRAEILSVSDVKCTLLDFDSEIKYVDFGSADLRGTILSHDDMLMLQAINPLEAPTTLSVVTADGNYHSFTVVYDFENPVLAWQEHRSSAKADTLRFSVDKTTHFICPEPITDILAGSENIIAEHAENIGNIVRAKALDRDFAESSLTLVSESGKIHTFNILPGDNPSVLDVDLSGGEALPGAIFNDASVNDVQMKELGSIVVGKSPSVTNIGYVRQRMSFALFGIYSCDDVLMFHLNIANGNLIDYEIDFVKCYIRDKKRSKTITVQEDEITPIYVYYPQDRKQTLLKGGESLSEVLFFRRFTIPQNRILCFEVFERNGGRHLQFSMSDKELLRAKHIGSSIH